MEIDSELWVCQDCLMFIANGDLTGLDYSPGGKEADERAAAIIAGAEEWGARERHVHADSSEETDRDFSSRACDYCHDKGPGAGAGSRHKCIALVSKDRVEGENAALEEIRRDGWTKETAQRWLAATPPPRTDKTALGAYDRGFDYAVCSHFGLARGA